MKKITSFLLVAFLLTIFSITPVFAATNAGIKPNNFFYFFDTSFEKINLFFTFNPEKKAKKALEYADERLAEAETLTDNKDSNIVKTVMENYTANIVLASEKSKEVKDQQASENLLYTIADNTSKNQEVLAAVLIKVPEEAREAITQAIEASRKSQEDATRQIAELKGEVEQPKQEVAGLKTKDEEREKIIEELSKQESEIISEPTSVPMSIKPTAPKTSEAIPVTISSQTKASESQSIPPANQLPLRNATNTTPSQTTQSTPATPPTQSPVTPEPSPIVSPTPTQISTPTPTPTPTLASTPEPTSPPKIEISVSSDNPVGQNIIKGEKGITVLKLNIENNGGMNVRIDNFKIKLVGTSFSNLQDLKIKIGGQLYSTGSKDGDIKAYNPGYTLNPKSSIQILVQADVALTADSDSFYVEVIEVSGTNAISGEGAKTSDVVTGNSFTIYQPAITDISPTISTASDISFLTNADDVGTVIHFDTKNNPFSVLKIALTFSGVNELDINNIKLLTGGNAWNKLYPTATNSATEQKVAYIEGNKIIFQNFSPYELFHVNRNEVLDLVILFEMKPTAFWKTLQVDIPDPLIDITAYDYETGLILPVGGSSIGNPMTITNKKYYSGY